MAKNIQAGLKTDKICRTCMNRNPKTSIFTPDETTGETYSEMIKFCASIQMYNDDGLPLEICFDCVESIMHAYRFKKFCEHTDRALKQQGVKNNRICRICMEEKVDMKSLSTVDEKSKMPISQLFESYVVFDVIDDNLPDYVCCECVANLNKSLDFKQMCFLSDFKLRVKLGISPENFTVDCEIEIKVEKGDLKLCNGLSENNINYEQQPHVCSSCGKYLASGPSLEKHMTIHTGMKPYQCEICTKTFARTSGLTVHRKIHTGEKPFECDECGRSFGRNDKLLRHKRTHSGEKPYVCEFCDSRFARSDKLQRHRLTHTGEKPHVCHVCDRGFARSDKLLRHLRTHTSREDFVLTNL